MYVSFWRARRDTGVASGPRSCAASVCGAMAAFCWVDRVSFEVLIAVHQCRKELAFRSKSSSRCKSAGVRRFEWVKGVGIGHVSGNKPESDVSDESSMLD